LVYGVGIIGYGFMGKIYSYAHANLHRFYSPVPCETRLVGACVHRAETMEEARRHGGFEFATTDADELLAREDIHIVYVATPNHLHAPLALRALEAGKAVYCDKPLCMDETEALTIARHAAGASTAHQMGLHYRFIPSVMKARELVEAGALGRIYQFRGEYLHAGYVEPDRPFTWRLDKSRSGGGALFDLGAHIVDTLRFLVGDMASVTALLSTQVAARPKAKGSDELVPIEVDDVALMLARTESGAVGTIEASRLATGSNDQMRFEIHGDKGAVAFNAEDPAYLAFYDATAPGEPLGGRRGFTRIECVQRYEPPAVWPGPKFGLGYLRFHVHSVYSFVQAIASGRPAQPDLVEGARTQLVLAAAQRSAASGREEPVTRIPPH
jgi:predicted dehydrogenase